MEASSRKIPQGQLLSPACALSTDDTDFRESMRILKKPLPLFLVFLCAFSGAAYALVIHSHHESAALSRFTMWCPGFAALCTCLLLRIPLGALGWGWPARRFLRLAYFLPLIYAAPVYLLTLARRPRRLLPQELRSRDGRYLWIGALARSRDVWRGSAAVVYHHRHRHSRLDAWRGAWMARVPVSQASATVRLSRCLPDLRTALGGVALSTAALGRL